MTEQHHERETLVIDVIDPEHPDRVTTPLFTRTRKELLERDGAHGCFICGALHTPQTPLEAHHHPVERSFAEEQDYFLLHARVKLGRVMVTDAQLQAMRAWNWHDFLASGVTTERAAAGGMRSVIKPKDIYQFVDDMTVNGVLLCKECHIGKDRGIHQLPAPIFFAQATAYEGTQFSDVEVIHHVQEPTHDADN